MKEVEKCLERAGKNLNLISDAAAYHVALELYKAIAIIHSWLEHQPSPIDQQGETTSK